MMTLLEIEERQEDILIRLEEIGDLIAEETSDKSELSQELSDLVLELATLRANIVFYSEMAEALEIGRAHV